MANEEILKRLDVLWVMLEEEGYYTKANTVAEAKRIIIEQDKFIEDAFKAHPNLDLDIEFEKETGGTLREPPVIKLN